jgi:hypothetical protein
MPTHRTVPPTTLANADATQLRLPFDAVLTVEAARVAIARAHGNALAARRFVEADELDRLGDQLVDLLERNAAAYRAGQS